MHLSPPFVVFSSRGFFSLFHPPTVFLMDVFPLSVFPIVVFSSNIFFLTVFPPGFSSLFSLIFLSLFSLMVFFLALFSFHVPWQFFLLRFSALFLSSCSFFLFLFLAVFPLVIFPQIVLVYNIFHFLSPFPLYPSLSNCLVLYSVLFPPPSLSLSLPFLSLSLFLSHFTFYILCPWLFVLGFPTYIDFLSFFITFISLFSSLLTVHSSVFFSSPCFSSGCSSSRCFSFRALSLFFLLRFLPFSPPLLSFNSLLFYTLFLLSLHFSSPLSCSPSIAQIISVSLLFYLLFLLYRSFCL